MTEESAAPSAGEAAAPGQPVRVPLRVVRDTTRERVPGALVVFRKPEKKEEKEEKKTQGEETPSRTVETDEDGDLPVDFELAPGTWSVTVFHRDYRPAVSTLTLPVPPAELVAGKKRIGILDLTRDLDQKGGRRFFVGLIAALLGLALAYVWAHREFPERSSIAAGLLAGTAELRAAIRGADDPAAVPGLGEQVSSLAASLDRLEAGGKLREALERAEAELGDLATLLGEGPEPDPRAALASLDRLAAITAEVAEAERGGSGATGTFLWSTGVKRYVEVLFWAFAGILVRLILTVARYLRHHTFYRSGWYLHAALLAVTPLLTLVLVLLIAMVEISSEAVRLDLSDPRILVAVSFLLAVTPWKLWDRLVGLAGELASGRGRRDDGGEAD